MAEAASDPKFDVDVVISIISAGKNSESRSKIRNGWKKIMEDRKDVKIKVLFFIPKTDDYTPQHEDEIVLDFKKKKLRGKAPNDGIIALVIYDWVQTNCRFNFLLRVQDGVFLRTELVDEYKQLKTDPNSARMIWGSIKYEEPVGDHQYIDVQLIERFIYQLPPHPQPAVFGLSYDVVALLVQHHRQDFLTYYSVEEVSLGIWLIGTRVNWRHDERMSANDCTNIQSFGVVPSNWDSAEENVHKCGHPCVSSC